MGAGAVVNKNIKPYITVTRTLLNKQGDDNTLKILLDIGHPKDVNVFKNVILSLQKKGHEIKIFARAKENTERLLKLYGFDYELANYYNTMLGKAFGIISNDLLLYKKVKAFEPDILVSPGSPYSAHISRLIGKPHIAFSDTEIAGLVDKITLPFTDKIYTSTSYYLDQGTKQIRFEGYYELAYLHPNYFKPNETVLNKYGIDGSYILIRLSALSSHHDIGAKGFNFKSENELKNYIAILEKYGEVIISSETSHWQIIKDHQLEINPIDLHDIIYFAKLCIGEGATMASEAAILGVPAIYVSNTERGYLNELEGKYGLVYNIPYRDDALKKAVEILENKDTKNEWKLKRDMMLRDKIDVVDFMTNVIESYA